MRVKAETVATPWRRRKTFVVMLVIGTKNGVLESEEWGKCAEVVMERHSVVIWPPGGRFHIYVLSYW